MATYKTPIISVYKITNLANNKVYIGQSWNTLSRWSWHKTAQKQSHFYAAVQKYGVESFAFEILREFRETAITQILLDSLETFYIKQYDSTNPEKGYNLMTGGNGCGQHSDFTKQKIRESSRIYWSEHKRILTPDHIAQCRTARLGTKHSEETKQKMSLVHKNLPPRSEEFRLKMREVAKLREAKKREARAWL